MEQIKVYDNFLDIDDLKKCEKLIKEGKWEYGHNSSKDNIVNTPFFFMNLENHEYFNTHLKNKIEKTVGQKVKLDRVYANGQTYGLDGCYHQDNQSENAMTFCLYISPIPEDILGDIGGNIFFKIPDLKNFSLALEPKYNRGVYFPSNYFHKGVAFNRYIKNMRISIAWKFSIIE
jgi:hypothetical protein